MSAHLPDLSAPTWTHRLVQRLERAALAIARLDARVSASFAQESWFEHVSLTGLAACLRAQRIPIDEIDIFSQVFSLSLPRRRPLTATAREEVEALAPWRDTLRAHTARHWAEALPFSFDAPPDWSERPALLRALELTARAARADFTGKPWLGFPNLLQDLGASQTALPCLVPADPAFRTAPTDAKAIVPRYLRTLADQAEAGLDRLKDMEADRLRAAAAFAAERRPGSLLPLIALFFRKPVLAPREVASTFGLTISGAGKLLDKAARLGLAVEITGRQSWRTFMAPAVALAFGFVRRPPGRPPSPALPKGLPVDQLLADFDAEMRAIDARLAQLGLSTPDSA